MNTLFTDFTNDGVRIVGLGATNYYEFIIYYTHPIFPFSTCAFRIKKDCFKFDFSRKEDSDYIYKLMKEVDLNYLEGAFLFNGNWHTPNTIRKIMNTTGNHM